MARDSDTDVTPVTRHLLCRRTSDASVRVLWRFDSLRTLDDSLIEASRSASLQHCALHFFGAGTTGFSAGTLAYQKCEATLCRNSSMVFYLQQRQWHVRSLHAYEDEDPRGRGTRSS
jgi:hypothetical protein